MAKQPVGLALPLPENNFGIGVIEKQTSGSGGSMETQAFGTIGTYQHVDPGTGGSPGRIPLGPYPICSCSGPGSSSVKQVQVLRNNIYKNK